MRLLPILAAATIGVFAVTAINSPGTAQQGTGNPSGAQNMDTTNKGNPNAPSAGQTTGTGAKAAQKIKKRRKPECEFSSQIKTSLAPAVAVLAETAGGRVDGNIGRRRKFA